MTKAEKVIMGTAGAVAAFFVISELLKAAPQLATLYGVVTDVNTGDPIPKVTVDVWEPTNGEACIKTTLTQADGSYEVIGIPPGNYRVEFSHTDCEKLSKTVDLGVGERKELNIQMVKRHYDFITVYGKTYDTATQMAIADTLVQCAGLSAYTDNTGHFIFEAIPAGEYTITFTHPDYETVERDIRLETEPEEYMEIGMTPVAVETVLLTGRVMNEEGNPIPWTDIFIYYGVPPGESPPGDWEYRLKDSIDLGNATGDYYIVAAAPSPPRYEIGKKWATLGYGENVVDFYLKLWAE